VPELPHLFDLVDATADGEVHGVKKDYWKVVDQCYLCDLCYMTKCPYVPPHEWNLDFPHLMLRAKAIKFKKGEVGPGEKFLASTDVHGQFAGIPSWCRWSTRSTSTKFAARPDGSHAGRAQGRLDARAGHEIPLGRAQQVRKPRVRDGQRTPGKVAIFPPATSTTTSPASATTCSRCWTTTRSPT
jgi:glycerol-3-phosphate dehydrogenase subunit C